MSKSLLKKIFLPIIAAVLVFILVDNDSFLYRTPVGEILSVHTVSRENVTDAFHNHDTQVTQELTIKLLNRNSSTFQLTNSATTSQTATMLYQPGQKVILSAGSAGYQIVSLKRDAVIAALFTCVIGYLVVFVRLRASLAILASLAINLLLFFSTVWLDLQWNALPALVIYSLLAILFAAVSLVFILGLSRQMFATFIATLLSTALTFAICLSVLRLTGDSGVSFEYLNYVTKDSPETLFFMGTIISVLGAIIDGTSDVIVGLFSIQRKNPATTRRDYFRSGLSIGREITGALTNVLFMIFIVGVLPMTLLLLHNGNSWSYISTVALNLGLLQTLISAIGIVLSIPITSAVASVWLTRKESL